MRFNHCVFFLSCIFPFCKNSVCIMELRISNLFLHRFQPSIWWKLWVSRQLSRPCPGAVCGSRWRFHWWWFYWSIHHSNELHSSRWTSDRWCILPSESSCKVNVNFLIIRDFEQPMDLPSPSWLNNVLSDNMLFYNDFYGI